MRNYDRVIVLALSVLTAVIWYSTQPIIFTYDSFAYLEASKSISGIEGGQYAYFRAPLLPLLLAVTGVPTAKTLVWFVLAQVFLGIATIMVMHACLRRISATFGLLATLLFISTFIAFVHSKSIMTEQIYLFAWCACIGAGLGFLATGSKRRLIGVTVALLVLAMSRAQGAFVSLVVLPFMALGRTKRWPEIIGSALVLVLFTLGYGMWHGTRANLIGKAEKASVSQFGITNSTGKMLFMVVYWDPYRRFGHTLIHPGNGPATARMFTELKAYYANVENLNAGMHFQLYGRFAGRPNDLVTTMENHPDGQYWWAIWQAMDARLGAGEADRLMLRVTAEALWTHPGKAILIYLRNFAVALVSADSTYVWTHRAFGPESVGAELGSEMVASGNPSVATRLGRFLNIYFPMVQLLILIGALVLAPYAWRSQRVGWLFCLALLVYNHLSVAVAATPESRYTFYAFPVLLVALTMGARGVWEKMKACPRVAGLSSRAV